jgi:uncharacterized membrane protein YgcG
MPFCSKCGTRAEDGALFCGTCGERIVVVAAATTTTAAAPAGVPSAQELTGVTSAVREYAAHAPPAEKDRKYGQQQWGLFETDYQRRKGDHNIKKKIRKKFENTHTRTLTRATHCTGITTDQSLDEIEDFAHHGPRAQPAAGRPPGATAAVEGGAPPLNAGSFGPGGAGSGADGGGSGGGGGGSGGAGAARRAGAGTGSMPTGGNAGAHFFEQHKAKEQAKYKPGYRS